MRFMKVRLIFVVVLGSIAFSEKTQPQIDIILDAVKSHRNRLVTYRSEYEIKTLSMPFSYFDKKEMFFAEPEDAVERVSKGSYLMDRENNRFKYETDHYDSWNDSQKIFEPVPFKVSNDGEKHTLFQATEDNYFAAIKNEKSMSQIGCNPRDFFNLSVKLLELVERDRDNILEVIATDNNMYKVVVKEPQEEFGDLSHEFILAPLFDWNIVSLKTFDKEHKLLSEEKIEYELIDGIPFVKSGYIHRYNADNPKELYWSDTLNVDINSVKINLPVKDEDFRINLPQGTRIYDHRYDLSFTIGGNETILRDTISDPAIMFASGKEYEDLPQKKIQVKATEKSEVVHNIEVDIKNATDDIADSGKYPKKKKYATEWLALLFCGISLIAVFVFARRRIVK